VIQTAAKIVIEPIFEADFEDNAYGYRGRSICFGRGRPTAWKRSRIDTCPTCRWQRRKSLILCESGHVAERTK
jgi:hypothetical protein